MSVLIGCGGRHGTIPPLMSQHFLYGIGFDPNGNCCTSASIYSFGEDGTGALTPLPGSPVTVAPFSGGEDFQVGLATDLQGRFLFIPAEVSAICCHTGLFNVYSIDSNTGTVNSRPIADTSGGGPIVFHPSGKFLYIASGQAFPPNPRAGCFGIDGRDLSTNNLASLPGSPFSYSQCMQLVSLDPAGHYLYASGQLFPFTFKNPMFETYTIDSNTGTLTLISTDSSPGVQPSGPILFQSSGKFAYALNARASGPVIDLYSVNPTTGALTFISTQVNNGLANPLMHPSGNFLYGCTFVAFGQPCQPVGYRVDANTGALTAIAGFSLAPGTGDTLIIDKSGRYAYALNGSFGNANQILVYSIDSSTGLMNQMPNLTTTVPAGLTRIVAGR